VTALVGAKVGPVFRAVHGSIGALGHKDAQGIAIVPVRVAPIVLLARPFKRIGQFRDGVGPVIAYARITRGRGIHIDIYVEDIVFIRSKETRQRDTTRPERITITFRPT